uniref:Coagulation factor II thrombin receptor like 2 n=1 Tax=Leptobrachium leishanense TaxID=445787 RepID=A0A8C5QBS7_9ANUR
MNVLPLALLLLSAGVFSLNENDSSLDTNASITINDTRTFRGKSLDYQPLPSHLLYEVTEPSTKTVLKHSSQITKRDPIRVNNSTLVFLRSSITTKLIPMVYIAVVIIGVPSNAIILWMLFNHVRSVCTAIFYTSLAVSDLLFCLMLPFRIAYHLNGNNWIFGEAMCKLTTILFYGNMYCSIFLLMGISISRYIAIVHPFIYRSLPKRAYTTLMCTLVWIVVLVFMIPFFTAQLTFKVDTDMVTCHDVQDVSSDAFQFHYFVSLVVFGFLIPLSIVTFCYFSIMRALTVHDHKRSLYAKITFLLLAIFAICFSPSNIILLIHQVRYHYNNKDDLYGCYLLALCLSSLNSCLDPFLYFLMSKITNPSSNYVTMNKTQNETHLKLLPSTT